MPRTKNAVPLTMEQQKEQRAKWNKTRYERHTLYHKIYYLETKYPYIFENNKEELKQWLESHEMTPTMEFIEYIRTFIIDPPPIRQKKYITALYGTDP